LLSINLSAVAVHLLATAIFVLAFFTTIVHILHRYDRCDLRLLHAPGTLASAAAFTAQTNIASLLDGLQLPEEMSNALQNRRFRIDPVSMKVVMEGESGFAEARSPGWK
jgi:hypothetical protein